MEKCLEEKVFQKDLYEVGLSEFFHEKLKTSPNKETLSSSAWSSQINASDQTAELFPHTIEIHIVF